MLRARRVVLDGERARRSGCAHRADARSAASACASIGERLDPPPGLVLMLNKPCGVTCSHKEAGPLVYDLLPPRFRLREPALSTIGRLDKETSGLLLITDDGALLHKIISPKSHVPKRYLATLESPLRGDEARDFRVGRPDARRRRQAAAARDARGALADKRPCHGDGGALSPGAPHVRGGRQPCRRAPPRPDWRGWRCRRGWRRGRLLRWAWRRPRLLCLATKT